jgi:peptidoglycan/xylan/chitin deacetylase (PgdA/CDA1 family)
LVEQFARLGLHLTFFVPGRVIENYPARIDLLLKNGHEIALHGHLHERSNEIEKRRRAVLAGPQARRLSQARRRRAARLAGAELRLLETFVALPARGRL